MNSEERWNEERPVSDFGIDVPAWIESDISPSTVEAICQGGCESGAYMPAVTYHAALSTMAEHGDGVLDYIAEAYGELPEPAQDASWAGRACFFLSAAVELWANRTQDDLEAMDEDDHEAA